MAGKPVQAGSAIESEKARNSPHIAHPLYEKIQKVKKGLKLVADTIAHLQDHHIPRLEEDLIDFGFDLAKIEGRLEVMTRNDIVTESVFGHMDGARNFDGSDGKEASLRGDSGVEQLPKEIEEKNAIIENLGRELAIARKEKLKISNSVKDMFS